MTHKDETTALDFLTVDEAAKVLRVGTKTVYRFVWARKVPAKKVGGRWRISRPHLEEFIGVSKPKA